MARIHTVGSELNSSTNAMEWTETSGGNIQSTTVISGTYTAEISSLSSGAAKYYMYQFAAAAGDGPYFFKFNYRVNTLPSAENRIAVVLSSNISTGLHHRAWITIDNTGVLRLYDEDGAIGSASSALSTGTKYRIEIQFDRTPASGSEVVRALLDGTEFAGSASRNLAEGSMAFLMGGNLNSEAQTTGAWFFDDFAVNDTTGSSQTTYVGEEEVVHLLVNADGDTLDWGTSAAGDDYTMVDEITPDDGTTFIRDSGTGTEDLNLAATPAAIATDDTISLVAVGWRFSTNSTLGTNPQNVLRIKASSGGTVEESAAIIQNATAWNTNATAAPRNHKFILYDLPGASATAFTKADLDTTQIGVRRSLDGTGISQVSTLWLLVGHTPAVAGGGVVVSRQFMTTNTRFF